MKKTLRYLVFIAVIGLLSYNSVYFKSLEEVKADAASKAFDVVSFTTDLMDTKITEVNSLEVSEFMQRLTGDFDQLMASEGKKLGVSNNRYFMIHGEGEVMSINEENVLIKLNDTSEQQLQIATDFIFGNTLRDASGLVSISDYTSTMDFNNISVEMNKIVRQKVLPPFISNLKMGDKVFFKGAIKINITEPENQDLRVISVKLEIKKQ